MLCLLLGVCIVTVITNRFEISEIAKILIILVSLPALIYASTKLSRNDSTWTLLDNKMTILFRDQAEVIIDLKDVKYMRNVPRSGGNLLMFFLKNNRSPQRFWRNKLFQGADDLDSLILRLKQQGLEYYYM